MPDNAAMWIVPVRISIIQTVELILLFQTKYRPRGRTAQKNTIYYFYKRCKRWHIKNQLIFQFIERDCPIAFSSIFEARIGRYQ